MPDFLKPQDTENPAIMFARTDDPEHHRLRRMMTSDFTFRRCEATRPQIQEMVDSFLHQMIASGPPADLVREFALPMPSLVIALLLGVPSEDLEAFQQYTGVCLDAKTTDEERTQSFISMYSYIQELVQRKEREPDQCIGANLARAEMQVAFATQARRLPNLQLAVPPEDLKFKDADIYGMKELPVTW